MNPFKKEITVCYSERNNIPYLLNQQLSAMRIVFGEFWKIEYDIIGENPPPKWKECETEYEEILRSQGKISIQFKITQK